MIEIPDFIQKIIDDTIESERARLKGLGTPEDEIDKLLSKEKLIEANSTLLDTISTGYVDFFSTHMGEAVLFERATVNKFLAHQERLWHEGFMASEMMYILACEAGDAVNKAAVERSEGYLRDKQCRYLALQVLYGRACQEYLEILCLVKNGFADGAFARWRSLYETCVVSEFISKGSEEIAKAFQEASGTDDSRFGWAKEGIQGKQGKKSNITFNDIQNECIRNECCFMDNDWKDRYRFSNQVVHTSPQGTFGRIGIPPSAQECMLAGRSDHGIAMPAIDAAVCLAMVSSRAKKHARLGIASPRRPAYL